MDSYTKNGVARASAVLPGAGAYDSSPTAIPLQNFSQIAFFISYARGGVGGSTAFKVEFNDQDDPSVATDWYQSTEVTVGALTSGSDVQDKTQRAEILYQATAAGAERFISPVYNALAKWARVAFKEVGATGTPGTVICNYQLKGFL